MLTLYSITMSSARNICFTLNNYGPTEIDAFASWDQITYLVYGKEISSTGTPHLQGYVEFSTNKKFVTITKKLPRAHLEARKGTAKQASDYCKKEDPNYIEIGTISNQGKRTDIEGATEMIINGSKMRDVALASPSVYVKFHRGLHAFKAITLLPRNTQPTITVLYGKTGTGKSKLAREMVEDPYVWGPEQGHWFDGYEGQTEVILEEFRGQLTFGMLLRLLDRYDCKVQYKGGMIEFVATSIIITSPTHPRDWYETIGDDKIDQLMRRISEIKMLDNVYKNALCQEDL